MIVVDFLHTQKDGSQRQGGRAVLLDDDKTVVLEKLPPAMVGMLHGGIPGPNGDVSPDDGKAFIDALPYIFSGSRLRCTKPRVEI